MKLNGNVTAVLLGVILTNTIGWGAFITRHQWQQDMRLAVIEEKLTALGDSLKHLRRETPSGRLTNERQP